MPSKSASKDIFKCSRSDEAWAKLQLVHQVIPGRNWWLLWLPIRHNEVFIPFYQDHGMRWDELTGVYKKIKKDISPTRMRYIVKCKEKKDNKNKEWIHEPRQSISPAQVKDVVWQRRERECYKYKQKTNFCSWNWMEEFIKKTKRM